MAVRERSKSPKGRRLLSKIRTRSAPPPPASAPARPAGPPVPCKEMPGSGNTGPVNVVGPPR